MAFDHVHQTLNGIYDFGDSGIGDLHQEFIYTSFISFELTNMVIDYYEDLTLKKIDRDRVEVMTGLLFLSELGDMANDPTHAKLVYDNAITWLNRFA